MEHGHPCGFYLTLQIDSVDGLHVTPDKIYDHIPHLGYSLLTFDEIIWLQQQDLNEDGFGNEGRYCPRGLENQGAKPNGIDPCRFFNREAFGHAFSEYDNCPTIRRREADDLSQYGDTNDWEY